jgi:hypothetical protein
MIAVAEPTDRDALRLRGEFLEFPGLIVTPAQAARLLGIRLEHAVALLTDLERENFLAGTGKGAYRRACPKKQS